MERPGQFVGVGIDSYEAHDRLDHAVAQVQAVAQALRSVLDGEPLLNADEPTVRDHLRALPECRNGSLVLLWCGHGLLSGSKLWLQTRNRGGRLNVADVVLRCTELGANQLLFIIDACQAGASVAEVAEVAAAVLEELPPDDPHVWFGVLVSCSAADIGARDGAFGTTLLRLLTDGPRGPDMQRRWSRHSRLIRGVDLGEALLDEWEGEDQRPDFLSRGRAWYMLPNPLWDPGAPEQVVEHLLVAARGGIDAEQQSWFTGRTAEVDEVVRWVTVRSPGVRVVTGSAGTGKSAIVGRVVSLSNPKERRQLADAAVAWPHADPGERAVAAHSHARGLTADRIAEKVDGQLVTAGVVDPSDRGRRNAHELVGELQRAAQAGNRLPVVVIDGLDEARREAFPIATDLVVPMARYASVIVSTRPLSHPEQTLSLLETLRASAIVDLDNSPHADSGRAAIRDYVVVRLAGVAARMDPTAVAERLLGTSGRVEDRPFLLARVITDQLRMAPIDTAVIEWEQHLARSIESALDVDLARVPPPRDAPMSQSAAATLARAMLIGLTWAFGAGFPEEEWLAVASALGGVELGREHVSWLLDALGRYVVQDGEDGVAAYRLAHQSLADHLRPHHRRTRERPFDLAAASVWTVLAERYAELLAAGYPAAAPVYLWRYGYRHAAAAGLDGLDALRRLADIAEELRPDVGHASLQIANVLAAWGRRTDAVGPAVEAVAIYREQAAENPKHLPDLGAALTSLGARLVGVGRHAEAVTPAEEAVQLYRLQATSNVAYLSDLASALEKLGVCYSEVGRHTEAIASTEEAVRLRRAHAADNFAYVPELATALTKLGLCYRDVGRHTDALAAGEEAVRLSRRHANIEPADVAAALGNLGAFFSAVGRHADAVTPAEEAVRLCRTQAADNPANLPDLATALRNLGLIVRSVGRRIDAIAPTEEAVQLYRAESADNPRYLPELAAALSNLGVCYRDVGRRADAIAPTEEAVQLCRELAADNVAYLTDLAAALSNLGVFYSDVGRRADAIAPTEEAVQLYRTAVVDNPAHLPALGAALTNLGLCYRETGRHTDAIAAAEEAVQLRRPQAADNPAYLPDLAAALTNLGGCYRETGRHRDAVALGEEAVQLRRAQAADNPAYLPALAMALDNLGAFYGDVGRRTDAIALTEEAVRLYRAEAADNPAYLPELARTLSNLGLRYREAHRPADAIDPTEDAVRLYRAKAADNPAYLPELAGALRNLGVFLRSSGRHPDAITPTQEAIRLYRAESTDNPAYLPDLAAVLINLDRFLTAMGKASDAGPVWQEVLDELDTPRRAALLLYRSHAADAGETAAATWLVEACCSDNRGLLAAAHADARRHRGARPGRWDAAWTAATGDLPPWLSVGADLLSTATRWVNASSVEAERDHLVAHPELLEAGADTAVAEALLDLEELEAARLERVRAEARAHDIDTVYRPLLASELAARFVRGDSSEQRALLASRREELMDSLVRERLADTALEEWGAEQADALLIIAATNRDELLAATFDALEDWSLFPALLDAAARDPGQASNVLASLAIVAGNAAAIDTDAALAALYLAVATAVGGAADDAAQIVREARIWAPGSILDWITRLVGVGATQQAVLPLIVVLTESGVEAGGDDRD